MSDPNYPNNVVQVEMQFPSVTQKAGEAVELIAKMSRIGPDEEDQNAPCDLRVELLGGQFGAAELEDLFQRGPSASTFVVGVPASSTDQSYGLVRDHGDVVGREVPQLTRGTIADSYRYPFRSGSHRQPVTAASAKRTQ